jgi:hypothetical protein
MMLEDTLIYNPPHDRTFAALLTADLENDGLEFFLRMSGDLGTVARETNRSAGDDLSDLLLTALVAAPDGRTAAWQQLYRGVRSLVHGFVPAASAGGQGDLSPAFRRLREFVRENADLAETLAIVGLERAAYCRAVSA